VIFSQESKGDQYMENKLYVDAINAYQKELKKNESGIIHQKIGKAYLYSKDYINSDKHYAAALNFDDYDDSTLFQFAKALVILNHKKEAQKYFDQYLKSYPNDYSAKLYIELYDSTLSDKISKANFSIKALKGSLNTSKSEFGAKPYDNGLLYISESSSDLVNNVKSRSTNTNYFSVLYSPKTASGYAEGKLFNSKINSNWHNGTVVLTPDKKEIYFTRTFRNRKAETMQLFSAEIIDGKITNVTPFEYNNKEYSIMHPCFSTDGNTLFFSSNKKGGKGGWDIYYSEKDRKYGWMTPKPINGRINSAGNEVFPHFHNKSLYFSSDGHFGHGGLDLFVAKEDDYYDNIINLGEPINSSKDDISIYYTTDNQGFFSSNRTSSVGMDDIYEFTELEHLIKVDSSASITGVFQYRKLAAGNRELILLNEFGEEIDRISTDKDGKFEFRKLKSGANYTIKPAEDLDDSELYLTNSKGEKVLLTNSKNGKFIFKTLAPSYTEGLVPVEDEDPSFLIIPVKGFVFRSLEGDLNARMEIKAYDENGNLIGRTYTNEDGSFIFKTLTPQNSYYLEIEGEDDDLQLFIRKKSKENEVATKQEDGRFLYKRIKNEGESILLVNEKNELIKIMQNERFSVDNILYATNSAELNIASQSELNKMYIMYKKNIHLTFTIESHTDSKGSDKYNLKLSEKRAKRVANYLIEKGVPEENIVAKGYGETKLINDCGNNSTCSDKEHALNRRTEIKLKGKKTDF
jgi:outer membrane protein OmpA-like peptidoglycan-associated protein